jgi:O-antigen/teichoic acid export membrane protein
MSIRKNYLYTTGYQILLIIIPFITIPYLSRVIGPSGIGVYAYSYSIATYFVLFAKLGLTNYGVRSIAKVKDKPSELNKTFSSIYYSQVIMSLILVIAYFSYLLLYDTQDSKTSLILSIYVISVAFDIDWVYFGIENVKSLMLRNVVIKMLMTVAIFTFVNHKNDLWLYAFIISAGTLISYLILWFNTKSNIRLVKVKKNDIIKHFMPSLKLFIPILAMSVYRTMDKIMVGQLSSMEQVGYYENAEKVIYMLMGFIASLGKVTMPRITHLLNSGQKEKGMGYIYKSMNFIIMLTSALSFGIAAIANEFTPIFFGVDFMESAPLMQYLSITILIVGWANVLRTQYLMPLMKDNIYILSITFGAILNIIINLLLINKFGAMGAVIGTIIAEFAVAVTQTIYINKEFNTFFMIKDNLKYIIWGMSMYIVVRFIGTSLETTIFTLLVQVLSGGAIYLSLLIIFDKDNLKKLVNKK